MSFFTDIIVAVLTAYLAFTNSLADTIVAQLSLNQPDQVSEEDLPQTSGLIALVSNYLNPDSIPDVLLKNAAYQRAAVLDATIPPSTADPIDALVNIFCTYESDAAVRTTTGTGWFIHPDGIILTNAHVAQSLLLANIRGDSECVIRTGNPATPTYTAELLYLPPAWIRENAAVLKEAQPKGTGERDYALLYVNSALNNQPMPRVFPSLQFNPELMRVSAQGSSVVAAGYPANVLTREGREASLLPVVATSTITELMTFGSNLADIFTIAGSPVGEQGASGGPVVDSSGNVIGMIVTRGEDALFGEGSLRALTISYIDRTMREESGLSLAANLSGDLPFRAALYQSTMVPFLEQVLEWGLRDE